MLLLFEVFVLFLSWLCLFIGLFVWCCVDCLFCVDVLVCVFPSVCMCFVFVCSVLLFVMRCCRVLIRVSCVGVV